MPKKKSKESIYLTPFAEEAGIKRKQRELNKLMNRNKEIDKLFERLYEDNRFSVD